MPGRAGRATQGARMETNVNRHSILEPGNLLIIQERERRLAAILRRHGWASLEDLRVFEAGCGGGYNLRLFVQWGARPTNLIGVDVDAASTAYCVSRSPEILVHTGSAERIPEPDRSFDISLAFTLFSSVHDEETAEAIATEMFRVTKPGGLILVYDMRRDNPRNPAVHAVAVDDLRRWFPKCPLKVHSLTLAPPIARPIARWAPWLYGPLAAIPPLRSHHLVVMRRPAVSIFE